MQAVITYFLNKQLPGSRRTNAYSHVCLSARQVNNPGQRQYLKSLFELFKEQLATSINIINGHLPPPDYKNITTATIIGFITGSLGVVWPWKKKIFKTDATGNVVLDSNGKQIIANYERYVPDALAMETWWAVFFVLLGIATLLVLDWYGKNRRKNV